MEKGWQLPAFSEKEVTEEPGNEGEVRTETWGDPCFSLFWEEPRVNVPGGFQAQRNYEKEAAESLLLSGHVQQSQWPPEPAFSPPFL